MPIITRDHSVDYFKGLLVIGMVYTHVLQFFSDFSLYPSINYSTQFFNLITFSGFVFCFGYVCQLAYYSKAFKLVYRKMLVTGLKTLMAFYISGIAFQVFVGNKPLIMDTVIPILLLQDIPGWSEFLVSFSLIILLGLALFSFFKWLVDRPILFWTMNLFLLTSTWIPYSQIESTYVGLLIGTTKFPTFPVLQYLPFYLIGIYYAKHRLGFHWIHFIGAFLGTFIFVYYLLTNGGHLPGRFPPSVYWIVGPTLILYLYFLFSKVLDKWEKGLGFLRIMGENVLFYLLLSNVFIFSLDNARRSFLVGPWQGLFFTFLLLLVITYFMTIIKIRTVKMK